MKMLLFPTIATAFIAVANVIFKEVKSWVFYVVFFLIMLICNMLFSSKAEAASIKFVPCAQIEIQYIKLMKKLSASDRQYYQDKRDFHKKEADRTFSEAATRCGWLPKKSDRDVAKNCFVVAVSSIAGGTPQSKAVNMLLVALTQYGLDVIDEFSYIENKLNWSKYHYEMYEFYNEILVQS